MDMSVVVKAHSGIALLTLIIFIVRGVMMLAGSSKVNSRLILGIASITTILLFGFGVYIAFVKGLSFADGFVLTKIIGLLLFVALGVIALKQGLAKPTAIILWCLGLGIFVYTYLIGMGKLAPLF